MAFSINGIPFGGIGKAKRKSFGVGSMVITVILGVILLAAGIFLIQNDRRTSTWPTVEGKVISATESRDTEGDLMYTPVTEYVVDSNRYTARSNISSSTKPVVGDSMVVAYNPTDPQESVNKNPLMTAVAYLFPIIGLAVIGLSIVSFIRSRKRGAAINTLKQSGIKIQGVVTEVHTQVAATSHLVVTATDASNQVRQFTSDAVNGSIFGLMNYQTNPIALDIYIDQSNPDNYYVDVDNLPSLTPDKIMDLVRQSTGTSPQTAAAAPIMNVAPSTTPAPQNTPQPTTTAPITPPVVSQPPVDPPQRF